MHIRTRALHKKICLESKVLHVQTKIRYSVVAKTEDDVEETLIGVKKLSEIVVQKVGLLLPHPSNWKSANQQIDRTSSWRGCHTLSMITDLATQLQ